MKVLPPKVTHDQDGNPQNSLPDDAPDQFVSVNFDGKNYVFREEGDDPPEDKK